MSLVYLLTHGQYDDTEPVAVFTTLVQAQSALPKADWNNWADGMWRSSDLNCDIHQIPFGKLPDGWLAEYNAAKAHDREFRARMQAEQEAEAARVAALPEAAQRAYRERMGMFTTSSVMLRQSETLT